MTGAAVGKPGSQIAGHCMVFQCLSFASLSELCIHVFRSQGSGVAMEFGRAYMFHHFC